MRKILILVSSLVFTSCFQKTEMEAKRLPVTVKPSVTSPTPDYEMVDTRQKPQTRPIPIIEKKEQKSQKKIDKTAKISGDQEIVRLFVYKNRIYYNEGLDKKLSIAISKSTYIPNEIADIEIGVEGAKAPLVATKGQGIGILENSRKRIN